jgi:transposase
MRATPKTYTNEFRSDAVALCLRGDRSLKQVATDIGVNHWTLRDWYNREEMAKRSKKKPPSSTASRPSNETTEEKVKRLEREMARLQKENEQLRMDREILKKAAAFFAKESE